MVNMEFTINRKTFEVIRSGAVGISEETITNNHEIRITINRRGNNYYLNVGMSNIEFKPVKVTVNCEYEKIVLIPVDNPYNGCIVLKPTFNGWENAETWHTVLILDNVEPFYKLMQDLIMSHDADMIKAYFTVWMQHPALCPVKEIFQLKEELSGLDPKKINWDEIVRSYRDQ